MSSRSPLAQQDLAPQPAPASTSCSLPSDSRASVAQHFTHYNLIREHRSAKMACAIAHGISDHICTVGELLERVTRQAGSGTPSPSRPAPLCWASG
jgi:hypothetical protein